MQAPRTPQPSTTDVQSPRGQDMPASRTPQAGTGDVQSPRAAQGKIATAQKLVNDAEQACKKGDMRLSSQKAKEAMAALK
jgi:hypothetical protein